MDKLVKRVTHVERSGQQRNAKVIYKSDVDEEEDDETPNFHWFERGVRRMLKAQLVAAQEAYERHLESAEKGKNAWLRDGPGNFVKANRKAMKEMRKASPFKVESVEDDED